MIPDDFTDALEAESRADSSYKNSVIACYVPWTCNNKKARSNVEVIVHSKAVENLEVQ